MTLNGAAHILDNPVWASLNTKHAHFATGTALVKHYPLDVFRGVGLADFSPAALRDLAALIPPDEQIFVVAANLPDDMQGWTSHVEGELVQMLCQGSAPEPDPSIEVVELGSEDVPEMQALVDLTRPGPFERRAIEFGHFYGIREQGELVAIAGERIHVPGFHEVSGVCTHPAHRGKGYARHLTLCIMQQHQTAGEDSFLHTWHNNEAAIRLYESLGFHIRSQLSIRAISH